MTIPMGLSQKLKASLVKHEGTREFPYLDVKGKIKVGIGYNLSDLGMKKNWIDEGCQDIMEHCYKELSKFPWFSSMNEDRQVVLCDMAYNLGTKNLMEFHGMLFALEKEDYEMAADEMLESVWAKQAKQRAIDLAEGMRSGKYGDGGKF